MLDNAILEGRHLKKMYDPPRHCKVLVRDEENSCVNVSGLSQADCCCSQAMMRSARIVLR